MFSLKNKENLPGPSCSKLKMSLVIEKLKFQCADFCFRA